MSAGHLIDRKGILDFIEMARAMPEAKFYWFGYTAPGLITAKIAAAIDNAPRNLIFPGFVCPSQLRDAYCGCDVFAFMSREETEGIVVLEALSTGIPTIVRNIPVYNTWLTHGKNVYKAAALNEYIQIAGAILDGSAPDLSENARETAEARSIEKCADALISIYMLVSAHI